MTEAGQPCPHCHSTATVRLDPDRIFCIACAKINGQPYAKPQP